jgi:hypothetical protein
MEKNKGGGDVRNHRAHHVPGVPSLKDLGIEERMVARWNHFTKAERPTESTSNTM